MNEKKEKLKRVLGSLVVLSTPFSLRRDGTQFFVILCVRSPFERLLSSVGSANARKGSKSIAMTSMMMTMTMTMGESDDQSADRLDLEFR